MGELTVLSLCSGIGGIDLGLERAGMRVIGQCELDEPCRRVLEQHWPGIPCIPDIRELRADVALRADVVAAGFPCQPVSQAGRRLAQDDPRWLWPEVARVVRELHPRYLIVENVRGLLRRGFHDVITDMARLGLDAQWGVLRASDVGAPHRRERIFIVAALPDADEPGSQGTQPEKRHVVSARSGTAEAATDADRASGEARGDGRPASPADTHSEPVDVGTGLRESGEGGLGRGRPDNDAGEDFDWGVYTEAIRRWEHVRGIAAPRPADEQRRLMPAFVEWMMGYDVGWTDGGSRTQRLKQVGNSVVPQCVELIGLAIAGRPS